MDDIPTDGFRHRPLWLAAVAGLVLAQAGLALSLFGPDRNLAAVLDDRPVLSGRHPLHLYHGALGADAFHRTGATTCYDPAFQAGYPKTPVFDGGCRPAELFLALAGGQYRPAAYKLGLFACLLLVPLAFVLAGRGAGLPAGAAVLAGVGGALLGWSWPVRRLVEEGELDFLMAGLGVVVAVPWLARYARWSGIDAWLVLTATAAAGWYAHPLVWLGLTPVVIFYYLVFAPRHGLGWHLGFVGLSVAGLAPNLWWLADWTRYWWLRQPSPSDQVPLPAAQAVLGLPGDYLTLLHGVPCGAVLVGTAAAGLVALWRAGHRAPAGLLLAAVLLCVAVARLLASWPGAPADSAGQVMPLAAGFMLPPAAFALWKLLDRARAAGGGSLVAVLGLLALGWADGPERPLAAAARLRTDPLVTGFSADQEQVIAALREHTTAEARVLWDDTTDHRPGWNWPALLPVLTERAYLGGLDHDSGVEHAFCGLHDGRLNGKGLAEWTDAELAAFCRWYNVGWVVCRSAAAADRWGRLPMTKPVARLREGGQAVVLYRLDRPLSFVLSGTAKWEGATPTRISLADVTPDPNGWVTLSLHNDQGLRVYPSYVHIEPTEEVAIGDPIKHVRLRLPGPVPRVTLAWENP